MKFEVTYTAYAPATIRKAVVCCKYVHCLREYVYKVRSDTGIYVDDMFIPLSEVRLIAALTPEREFGMSAVDESRLSEPT